MTDYEPPTIHIDPCPTCGAAVEKAEPTEQFGVGLLYPCLHLAAVTETSGLRWELRAL